MLEGKTGSITVRVVTMGWKDDVLTFDDNVYVSIGRIGSSLRPNNFDVCRSDLRVAYRDRRFMYTFE